jgi:hypothetical protein
LPMGRIPSPDQNNTCPSELAATLDIYIWTCSNTRVCKVQKKY